MCFLAYKPDMTNLLFPSRKINYLIANLVVKSPPCANDTMYQGPATSSRLLCSSSEVLPTIQCGNVID